MTSLRALLFDLDGTLVDSEELHRQSFNQAFLKFGLGWSWSPEVYAGLLNVSGGVDRISVHIDRLPMPPAEADRLRALIPGLHREKTRLYGEFVAAGGGRVRPGIARLFAEARADGIKIGIAATSAITNVQTMLGAVFDAEARKAIGAVAGADLVERKKPAPDIYRLLMSMLWVAAEQCVALEDSSNGLAAAKAAGLVTIVTPSRWTRAQDFTAADLLLERLGDPEDPLDDGDAARIGGAQYLGLAQIKALQAAAVAAAR